MSFGPFDYPDWQRQDAAEATAPAWQDFQPVTGIVNSPVIPCFNFPSMYVYHRAQGVQTQFILWWALDALMATRVGGRQIPWDPACTTAVETVFPNLGPYAQITIQPNGGGGINFNDVTYARLTSQYWSPGAIQATQDAGYYTPAIPAAGNFTKVFGECGGGNVQFTVTGGSQGVNVVLNTFSVFYTYIPVDSYSVAANGVDVRTRVMPIGPMQIVMTNQSAVNPNNTASVHALPLF